MMQDYSVHTVALQHLLAELAAALRDKRYSDADHFTAQAMSRLARVHACIARLEQDRTPRSG